MNIFVFPSSEGNHPPDGRFEGRAQAREFRQGNAGGEIKRAEDGLDAVTVDIKNFYRSSATTVDTNCEARNELAVYSETVAGFSPERRGGPLMIGVGDIRRRGSISQEHLAFVIPRM